MRRLIVMMSVSLDGFFEGPGHDLSWQLVDEALHAHFNAELAGMSAFLDGRVTWELMASFWPTADADPAAPPVVAEFAAIWREMPKLVYSTTLHAAGWNTEVVRHVVPEEVRALKAQPGGDMVVGGAQLASSFQRLGLVDEYRLYVHPVVIGDGRRRAPEGARADLRLVETRAFLNGVVLLRYATGAPPAGDAPS